MSIVAFIIKDSSASRHGQKKPFARNLSKRRLFSDFRIKRRICPRVYLKNSLRLHHGVFSAISASENLDLAPLNLRFPSLN